MESSVASTSTLRERTRRAMRDEVAAVAMRLFAERGFENVTTTEIAEKAGVSPRSFFRYFPTKEDVLLGGLDESGQRVRDALLARPDNETAWVSLRQALRVLVENPVFPAGDLRAMVTIIVTSPSIRSREAEKHRQWEALLAPELARRLVADGSVRDETAGDAARAIIGSAMAAMRIASEQWARQGNADPLELFDELVRAIRTS